MRFNDIIQWAEDRNLIEGSSPMRQFYKLEEEFNELKVSLIYGESPIDDIGDMIVVLTIIAKMHDLTIEECIEHAWNEIKDRKGRMVDGVFVKEAQ